MNWVTHMRSDDGLREIVLPLSMINHEEISRVGGKAANLARLNAIYNSYNLVGVCF